MTRLAVVAYPDLSEVDRRWIEGIRFRNDPLAFRIPAHFTLVFPAELDEAPVVAQVQNTLRFSASIAVVLRRAAVSPDVSSGGYYVSLLAGEGCAELFALHNALYDSILATSRRRDIRFIPHLTVGRHEQMDECERIANRLNEERRCVRTRVQSVDVVDVGNSVVRTVAEIRLGLCGNQPLSPAVQQPGSSRCSPPGC